MPFRVIDFPPFRLDLEDERLWRDGVAIPLRPKAFAVLRVLVEQPGRLVTKEALWAAVWPETAVTDDTLTKSIREVRLALGDDASAPRFIETVHRRGFRWIAQDTARRAVGAAAGAGAGPGASASRGAAGWVVGREAEVAELHACLEDALLARRRTAFIAGEAGIGKTTLVDAFFARLAGDDRVALARGQAVESYGAGEAYSPVLEALERLCRDDHDAGRIRILREHAPMWLAQMPSLVGAAEREALQRETAGATPHRMVRELARAIEVLTADRGLVLCIDDLQWSDPSTLTLLDFLARRREPARLLLIGIYRPDDVRGRDHPLSARLRELRLHGLCTELTLQGLGRAAIAEYAVRRLGEGARPISDELAAAVHRRTEGNPLFMVHLLNDLLEGEVLCERDGRWELRRPERLGELPRGVREFIEQRLECLSAPEQEVLEAAAVAGLEFSAAAVAAGLETSVVEVERHCASLARREQFLQEVGSERWPDGTVASSFRFRHALHHELLGTRSTSARRALLHRRIGERKEHGHADRAAEIAPQLALHFEAGGDPLRAIHYLARAAETAARRRAPLEAIAHLRHALDLLGSLPEGAARDREELALQIALGVPLLTTRGYAAPEVERTYERARELCRGLAAVREVFPVLHGLWVFYEVRGELVGARELAEELFALANQAEDPGLRLQAHHVMGETRYLQGEHLPALDHLDAAIALYDARRHHELAHVYGLDPGVVSCCYAAWTLYALGSLDRADERSRQAVALAHEVALPLTSAVARIAAAGIAYARGETGAMQEHAEAAIELSLREGLPLPRARGAILHGWALVEQGFGERGIAEMREGLDAYAATGARAGLPYFLALLAEALGKLGDPLAGLEVAADALHRTAATGERHYETELLRIRGDLLFEASGRSREAEAETSFRTAIEIAAASGARLFELRAARSLARLWQARGKASDARALLGRVYETFTEGFATADLRTARDLLAALG